VNILAAPHMKDTWLDDVCLCLVVYVMYAPVM